MITPSIGRTTRASAALLTIAGFSIFGSGSEVRAPAAATAGVRCNGLLAFAFDGVQNTKDGIYAISLDGRRKYLGFDGSVSVSPDGRRLAYVGAAGVVVASADGSNAHSMLLPKGAWLELLAVRWAPDSSRLAITAGTGGGSVREQKVIVFDAVTGAATTLGTGSNPRWSPDGST